jgi:hypothetical protein
VKEDLPDALPDEFEITVEVHGRVQVTGFCPVCKVQLFAYTGQALAEDLCDHLNAMHPCPKGRAGNA